jgi:hypothetical protein
MTKKYAVISGLFFGALMACYFSFVEGVLPGLISGLLSGIAFGAIMYWFANSKMVKRQTHIDEEDAGSVLYAGAANHFLHGEGVGGKLYLLHNRLQFKSHRFNVQNHELQLDMDNIKNVSFYNTLGLIPNGLKIETTTGKTEKFVVNNRKQWKDEIIKMKTL